jgi:alanine racemase
MISIRHIIIAMALVFLGSPSFAGPLPVQGNQIESAIDAAAARFQRAPSAGACPAFVEVDATAFTKNIKTVKTMIGPGTKLCLVMKSDAYGHGLENLIAEAVKAGPDYIALVENSEIAAAAAYMRASGRKVPILRIAPATLDEAVEAAVKGWNVEELAGSAEQASLLSSVALRLGKKTGRRVTIPIHVNIDTGMGRMGAASADEVRKILALPGLRLKGIMTHFAQSDDPTDAGKKRTLEQMKRFEGIVGDLGVGEDVIIHTANSAATSKFPWTWKNMVRVGSLIYGDVNADTDPKGLFLPVMASLKSTVAIVLRDVPPGTTVGYDSIFRTREGRTSTLAAVRIGYNNGYPKDAYVNGTEVLIGGRRYPAVGKTSMNLLVVDITDGGPSNPVRIGDEVVLMGRQGSEAVTMEELASRNKLTTYEMLLRLGKNNRIKVIRQGGAE